MYSLPPNLRGPHVACASAFVAPGAASSPSGAAEQPHRLRGVILTFTEGAFIAIILPGKLGLLPDHVGEHRCIRKSEARVRRHAERDGSAVAIERRLAQRMVCEVLLQFRPRLVMVLPASASAYAAAQKETDC